MTEIFLGKNLNKEVSLKNDDSLCCKKCCANLKNGKLDCKCGETDGSCYWFWDYSCNGSSVVITGRKEVLFHPVYSSGTAVVKGTAIFEKNFHYYFEVKILTSLYGTDVMVGVAKSDLDVLQYRAKFCSLLGLDKNSWGYSYSGCIQHNNLKRKYSKAFGMGSLVGVHLDMYKGTLEYYLNRKPLGVAFTGLKNFDLKAMVCSTAAQSSIKLTCSERFTSSLQLEALLAIHNNPILTDKFLEVPGLRKLCQRDFFWIVPKQKEPENKLELEDEVLLPLDKDGKIKRKKRLSKWGVYVNSDDLNFKTEYPNKSVKRENCKCSAPIRESKKETKTNTKLIENIEAIHLDLNEKREVLPQHFRDFAKCDEAQKKRYLDQIERDLDATFFFRNDPIEENDPLCSEQIYDLGIPEPSRSCLQCSFRLGTHQEITNDPYCSFCDGII